MLGGGGGFFRGTSLDQDSRFGDKEKKLIDKKKWPAEFEKKVDMSKVSLDVLKPWISKRITELLGFEDEVLIGFVISQLEIKRQPLDPKRMSVNLTGFLEKQTVPFVLELWNLLLSAQESIGGIPQRFLEEKKEELRRKKAEAERIEALLRRKKEASEGADASPAKPSTATGVVPPQLLAPSTALPQADTSNAANSRGRWDRRPAAAETGRGAAEVENNAPHQNQDDFNTRNGHETRRERDRDRDRDRERDRREGGRDRGGDRDRRAERDSGRFRDRDGEGDDRGRRSERGRSRERLESYRRDSRQQDDRHRDRRGSGGAGAASAKSKDDYSERSRGRAVERKVASKTRQKGDSSPVPRSPRSKQRPSRSRSPSERRSAKVHQAEMSSSRKQKRRSRSPSSSSSSSDSSSSSSSSSNRSRSPAKRAAKGRDEGQGNFTEAVLRQKALDAVRRKRQATDDNQ